MAARPPAAGLEVSCTCRRALRKTISYSKSLSLCCMQPATAQRPPTVLHGLGCCLSPTLPPPRPLLLLHLLPVHHPPLWSMSKLALLRSAQEVGAPRPTSPGSTRPTRSRPVPPRPLPLARSCLSDYHSPAHCTQPQGSKPQASAQQAAARPCSRSALLLRLAPPLLTLSR